MLMKIATWNINGIRARKDSLLAWIDEKKPDIIVLEELKAQVETIPEEILSLNGYTKFWNGSTFKKGYSGIGFLLREGIDSDCRFEIPDFDRENRTGVVHYTNLTVIGTYVPRGDGDAHYAVKLNYLSDLSAYIQSLLQEGRQVIHAGDVNVAHTELDVHRSQNKPEAVGLRPEERAAIDRHLAVGLHDIMRERFPDKKDMFTWWPYWKGARERNLGWRIDCFYLSDHLVETVRKVSVDLDEKSSDHAPVILELEYYID